MRTSKAIGFGLLAGAAYFGYKLYSMGKEVSAIAVNGLSTAQVRHSKTMAMLMNKPFGSGIPQKVEKIGPSGMSNKTAASWKKLVTDRHPASISLVKGIG